MLIIKKPYSSYAVLVIFWVFLSPLVKEMDETLALSEMENEDQENNLIENLSFADLLRKLLSIPEVGSLDITNYLLCLKWHTTFHYNI